MKKILTTTFILAAGALCSNAASIHTGLLSYWDLNGNGNDTASSFTESTGAVADTLTAGGTAGAATIASSGGLFGGSGVFDRTTFGSGGFLAADGTSADLVATGESITISVWAKFDTTASNWQGLVVKGEDADYRLHSNRNTNSNFTTWGGGDGDANGDVDIKDTDWHHILATTNASDGALALYIDGVLDATGTGTGIVDNGFDLHIGNNSEAGARMWDGLIDDVAIWDRALTQADVTEIYDAGIAGTSLGLIGVPEPSSSLLLSFSGLMLALRRRR